MKKTRQKKSLSAFTLIEVVVVFVIVALLTAIGAMVFLRMIRKADVIKCHANLKALYGAAYSYVEDHRQWPQEPEEYLEESDIIQWWLNELQPYGIQEMNWICPSHSEALDSEMKKHLSQQRFSYRATNFDGRPTTPWKWGNHPWFIEVVSYHDNGDSYYIVSDGSIRSFKAGMSQIP